MYLNLLLVHYTVNCSKSNRLKNNHIINHNKINAKFIINTIVEKENIFNYIFIAFFCVLILNLQNMEDYQAKLSKDVNS